MLVVDYRRGPIFFALVVAPPAQLVVLLVLGAIVGAVASWQPARRAAKLELMTALAE